MTNPPDNVALDYLVVGHVTRDLTPDGGFRAGGTATYSALAAHRLGARVGVVTSADPTFALFHETPAIRTARRISEQTTAFENIYIAGRRQQFIRAVAATLTSDDLPSGWEQIPVIHLGPVAQEISSSLVDRLHGKLLGVTPQGWLRRWDEHGLVSPSEWVGGDEMLSRADVVVVSMEDLGDSRAGLARYVRQARLLVLTVGAKGAIVHHRGQQTSVPAYEVNEQDPTGAGDLFATAFLLRFFETNDTIESARFANSAASFVVEGLGIANVPTREQVEWRMRYGRLRGQV